jgi:hypothetical protein
MYKRFGLLCLLAGLGQLLYAQKNDSLDQVLDSLFIENFENRKNERLKLLHAEPLYIDLIRDLGARKGEREWNFGTGLTDNLGFDKYEALVEYEWAPADRLGLEVELPFTFYYNTKGIDSGRLNPGGRLNSLKLASQWTFLVNAAAKTSLAVGYLHEFLLPSFRDYGKESMLTGHLAEPFFIAAKRWGKNYHTLLYTGPVLEYTNASKNWNAGFQANISMHYMLPGTRNFLGVETNMEWGGHDFDMVLRPQMRLAITDHLLIGIVAGIPVRRENQRLSSFCRLIYEPESHNKFKKR